MTNIKTNITRDFAEAEEKGFTVLFNETSGEFELYRDDELYSTVYDEGTQKHADGIYNKSIVEVGEIILNY